MADEYPFHAEGATYVCNCCGKAIADGANVLGTWSPTGDLVGVRAFIEDKQVHRCGAYVDIDVTVSSFDVNTGEGASNG